MVWSVSDDQLVSRFPYRRLEEVSSCFSNVCLLPLPSFTFRLTTLVSITIGILISFWIDYGSNYIGGTRCAPSIPYTGGTPSKRTFNPYTDIPADGKCTGQSEASWRLPFALQIIPALSLGIGMLFFPDSPRWLLMHERDDDALATLCQLRRKAARDDPDVVKEYLEIKASIMLENSFAKERWPELSGIRLEIAQYVSLVTSWPRFKRLAIGCVVMFFQQFMGCNGMRLVSFSSSRLSKFPG